MGTANRPPLLCFSHLRWDFVWQRPQHVISRLARDREVFFVEEPLFEAGAGSATGGATFRLRQADGVTVAQPVCADPGPGGGPALDAMYARLTDELVRARDLSGFTAWFYTPMLLPAVSRRAPGLVVYDAMDELALFKGAPAELLPRDPAVVDHAGEDWYMWDSRANTEAEWWSGLSWRESSESPSAIR